MSITGLADAGLLSSSSTSTTIIGQIMPTGENEEEEEQEAVFDVGEGGKAVGGDKL